MSRKLLGKTLDSLLIYPGGSAWTLQILQTVAVDLFDLSSNEISKDLIRQINENRQKRIIDSSDDFNLKLPKVQFFKQHSSTSFFRRS